jgi:Putative DNA-binding domain
LPPELIHFQRDFARALDRPADGAMAVYRTTVIHGAVEALRANYPVVERIVGEEMFGHVAVDFASTHPPREPVLAHYGAEFADWLRQQEWTGELPYLPDVARIERLHVCSLFAPDEERLSLEHAARLARLTGTSLRLHPATCFAWLLTPAMSIWLAHQQQPVPEIAPEWRGEGALFARPKPFTSHAVRIGEAAHRLLSGIRLGESLGASMAAAAHLYPQEDSHAVLASLIKLGVFVAPVRERN